MKKYLLLITCFVSIVGCSKTVTNWTFENRSSETVYIFNINPDGQPSNLTLDLSTDAEVSIIGRQIDYDYGPADVLRHERDHNQNRIIFYNKD